MTQTTAVAPPGRVYAFDSGKGRSRPLSDFLEFARIRYAIVERREAQWARVNPADFDRFEKLWPGCVVAEDAQLKGTVRLGRD